MSAPLLSPSTAACSSTSSPAQRHLSFLIFFLKKISSSSFTRSVRQRPQHLFFLDFKIYLFFTSATACAAASAASFAAAAAAEAAMAPCSVCVAASIFSRASSFSFIADMCAKLALICPFDLPLYGTHLRGNLDTSSFPFIADMCACAKDYHSV